MGIMKLILRNSLQIYLGVLVGDFQVLGVQMTLFWLKQLFGFLSQSSDEPQLGMIEDN